MAGVDWLTAAINAVPGPFQAASVASTQPAAVATPPPASVSGGHSGPDFVAKLHADPHFAQYASILQGAGVPEWIGDAVIANEDPSLATAATGTDAPSKGWFQINLDAHPTVTAAQAQDVGFSTAWFAQRVAPVLAANPALKNPANVDATVKALEALGWPGGNGVVPDGKGGTIDETPTRVADAKNVLAQLGVINGGTETPTGGSWGDNITETKNADGTYTYTNTDSGHSTTVAGPAAPAWLQSIYDFLGNLATEVFLGSVAVALIGGGIAWLASTNSTVRSAATTAAEA